MPPQRTCADVEYKGQPRQTRRERFLQRMDALMPWARLEARIRPVYPTGARGRPPYPLPLLLRIHCVQLFYNLSDPAMDDALYDSEAVQRFVGLTARGPRPDETTILHFRHLLEQHQLGEGLLAEITQPLAAQGLRLRAGTKVDATILDAPASTKNRAQARDPEMHQVKQGNQWSVGMKAHIGVDAATGLGHSVAAPPANVADITPGPRLRHGAETQVWGDAGYLGVERRPEHLGRAIAWQLARRPGQRRRLAPGRTAVQAERRKASIRAKVEHPFLYVMRHFGYAQVRYRGLAKNRTRLCLWFGLANLLLADRAAPARAGAWRPARERPRPAPPVTRRPDPKMP